MTDLDPNKPVQLPDGRIGRVICTDRKCKPTDPPEPPWIVLVDYGDHEIHSYYYPSDLINVPEKVEGWFVIVAENEWIGPRRKPISMDGDWVYLKEAEPPND